jgi:hypothetical protein
MERFQKTNQTQPQKGEWGQNLSEAMAVHSFENKPLHDLNPSYITDACSPIATLSASTWPNWVILKMVQCILLKEWNKYSSLHDVKTQQTIII